MVELLIALVIVGIMVMTVAPGLQQILGDNRQQSASADLVRMARNARAAALHTGAAHMLRFTAAGPGTSNLGQVELYVGMTNSCRQARWDLALTTDGNSDGRPDALVSVFDMTAYNPALGTTQPTASDSGRQVITLRAVTVNSGGTTTTRNELRICYQPNGDAYMSLADTNQQLVLQRDRAQFTIARTIDGTGYGMPRRVRFPVSGSSRFD